MEADQKKLYNKCNSPKAVQKDSQRDSKEDMMKVMLTSKDEYPTDERLQQYFSETEYELYRQLLDGLHKNDLQEQWNYYRDGKSWLGKIMFKRGDK